MLKIHNLFLGLLKITSGPWLDSSVFTRAHSFANIGYIYLRLSLLSYTFGKTKQISLQSLCLSGVQTVQYHLCVLFFCFIWALPIFWFCEMKLFGSQIAKSWSCRIPLLSFEVSWSGLYIISLKISFFCYKNHFFIFFQVILDTFALKIYTGLGGLGVSVHISEFSNGFSVSFISFLFFLII